MSAYLSYALLCALVSAAPAPGNASNSFPVPAPGPLPNAPPTYSGCVQTPKQDLATTCIDYDCSGRGNPFMTYDFGINNDFSDATCPLACCDKCSSFGSKCGDWEFTRGIFNKTPGAREGGFHVYCQLYKRRQPRKPAAFGVETDCASKGVTAAPTPACSASYHGICGEYTHCCPGYQCTSSGDPRHPGEYCAAPPAPTPPGGL